MNEIEIVGDGAHLVTSVQPKYVTANPDDFQLFQNYPNPFNPSTTIEFYLPSTEYVILKIYSITGQEIETLINRRVSGGLHEIHWIAKNLANGVYVYRIQAGKFSGAKKLIYQK